ncbi:MAG: CotH kinase family protein [Verrucomicrobia bacterium]|nr:CotH kinase family protein [Verrucomicrobiota bacterium]
MVYNTGFRDKGSPYHGGSGDIAATTPRDQPLLGTFDRVFASTGNGGSEPTAIRSQLAAWYGQQLGIPYLHAHYMRLYFNGSLFRPDIMEDLEQPNHDFAERWFPSTAEGDLYKIAVWFEFNDDNLGFNPTGATLQRFTTLGGEYKLARYRWNWQRRSNDGDASNYDQFFDLVSAFNDTSANYVPRAFQQANVEQWMRVFCYDYAMGNWDAWTYNVGQNMYLYRPTAQRWVLLPWDIDFVFGLGDGTSTALRGGGQDPTMSRAYSNPTFQRMNWRAYQDTVSGPFLAANFQPQIDARRSVLLKNSVAGISTPTSITSWINGRRTFINNQLNAADPKTFEITTNSGADFESTTPTVTLTGTAPFAVATLEVNGVPYPVQWANTRTFNLTVPLTQTTNLLTLVGRDLRGNPGPPAPPIPSPSATPAPSNASRTSLSSTRSTTTPPRTSPPPLSSNCSTVPPPPPSTSAASSSQGVGYTFPHRHHPRPPRLPPPRPQPAGLRSRLRPQRARLRPVHRLPRQRR